MLRKAFSIIIPAIVFLSVSSSCLAQSPLDEMRLYNARFVGVNNGNTFLFPAVAFDTILVDDPVTNEQVYTLGVKDSSRPIAINGKKIYNNAEVTTAVERRNDIIPFSFEEYVLNKIKPDLKTLPDGSYYLHLDNIVVDKRGNVQYYSVDTLSVLRNAVAKAMKGPLFVPARVGHKKVAAIYESYTSSFEIVVKSHEVTFIRDKVFPTVKSNM